MVHIPPCRRSLEGASLDIPHRGCAPHPRQAAERESPGHAPPGRVPVSPQVIVGAAGPSCWSPATSSRDVTHPRFNRLFRGLMSSRRSSHGPADVIPPVWRCHCRPERTLSESVHCLRPVEGRFTPVPATKSRLWPLCHGTQTPVHPLHCADALRFGGAWKGLPYAPPHGGTLRTLCPDHRRRPPAPSGVPARDYAQADSGALEMGTERLTGTDSELRRTFPLSRNR